MVTGFGNLDCLVLGDFEDARRVQDVTGKFRVREMDNALPPNQRGCLWVRLPNLHPGSKNAVELFRHSARSEEHTSELQSLMRISYAVFCLKKKRKNKTIIHKNPH